MILDESPGSTMRLQSIQVESISLCFQTDLELRMGVSLRCTIHTEI